jgi:hypothetical protein
MEIYGVVAVECHAFLTIALKGIELPASHPDVLTLRKRVSRTHRVRRPKPTQGCSVE